MTLAAAEAEVRQQIDKRLTARGWVLDLTAPNQDVFVERAVVPRLSTTQQARLGSLAPDYSLFCDGVAVGVLEAKKPTVPISAALAQGVDYAQRLDVEFVFACNGPVFKSLHLPTGEPLRLNEAEVAEPLSPVQLRSFREASSPELVTVPQTVIASREELIEIFERLNNVMRQAGVRVGIDRFTEFANILFLKLASERARRDGYDLARSEHQTCRRSSQLPERVRARQASCAVQQRRAVAYADQRGSSEADRERAEPVASHQRR